MFKSTGLSVYVFFLLYFLLYCVLLSYFLARLKLKHDLKAERNRRPSLTPRLPLFLHCVVYCVSGREPNIVTLHKRRFLPPLVLTNVLPSCFNPNHSCVYLISPPGTHLFLSTTLPPDTLLPLHHLPHTNHSTINPLFLINIFQR